MLHSITRFSNDMSIWIQIAEAIYLTIAPLIFPLSVMSFPNTNLKHAICEGLPISQ